MVTPDHIGQRVAVRSAGTFYAFIDGWEGRLSTFENGFAIIKVPSTEFPGVDLTFYVDPEQLEIIE